MSDAGDEDFEVRLIEVEETVQVSAAAPAEDIGAMFVDPSGFSELTSTTGVPK